MTAHRPRRAAFALLMVMALSIPRPVAADDGCFSLWWKFIALSAAAAAAFVEAGGTLGIMAGAGAIATIEMAATATEMTEAGCLTPPPVPDDPVCQYGRPGSVSGSAGGC